MTEIIQPLKLVADTHLVAEFQKEYTLKLQETVRRGLKLFAVDPIKMEAKEVKTKKEVMITLDGETIKKQKAIYDPSKSYVWALNEFNAVRKVQRALEAYIINSKKRR